MELDKQSSGVSLQEPLAKVARIVGFFLSTSTDGSYWIKVNAELQINMFNVNDNTFEIRVNDGRVRSSLPLCGWHRRHKKKTRLTESTNENGELFVCLGARGFSSSASPKKPRRLARPFDPAERRIRFYYPSDVHPAQRSEIATQRQMRPVP